MSLRLRRGTDTARSTMPFDDGEPVWTTGTIADGGKKLYIGDGATDGGVLVNPSISLDVDPDLPADAAETVVVERSRSTYEDLDDLTMVIDLALGNNFRIDDINTAGREIRFDNANVADGQSGYIVIGVGTAGDFTFKSTDAGATVFAVGGALAVANLATIQNVFVSYTVANGSNVYLTSATVTAVSTT